MRHTHAIVILTFIICTAAVGAVSDDSAAHYRMLDWKNLVPENWEPPLIPPGHDSEEASKVPQEATVADLDGTMVTLPGYIKTAEFDNDRIKALLLVPFLPHHTKQHAHLDANQRVFVSLLEPTLVDNPLKPIWVVGTLSVDTTVTEEGPAAYRIADAVISPYNH